MFLLTSRLGFTVTNKNAWQSFAGRAKKFAITSKPSRPQHFDQNAVTDLFPYFTRAPR
jgi:hypothetical protein